MLKINGVQEVAVNLDKGEVVALMADGPMPPKSAFEQAIVDAGMTLVRIEMPRHVLLKI